ncbi:MAG: VacJ family lipoprotein [Betaproteobacteria bacterium]
MELARHCGVYCCIAMCLAWNAAHAGAAQADPHDPLEPLNRVVFAFNDLLDRAVVKPVAVAYTSVAPRWMRKGVSNFFGNLGDVWSLVNNAVTLRPAATADSLERVMVNSTVGLLGVVDVATSMDIEKHTTDFGTTLGRWGVSPGPYVVLPFLGSYTLREVVALPVDRQGNLVNQVQDVNTRDGLTVLSFIDVRASYLKAGDVIDGASLDPYSFTRDSYLQRQRYRQYDGEVPEATEAEP